MKSRIRLRLFVLLILALVPASLRAQQPTPSPSPSPAKQADAGAQKSAEEQDWRSYTVTSSLEVGVRGLRVRGDDDKYRSDLNYSPGVRLFDSSFLMRAKENTAGLAFDSLLVNSTGFGGDPNGYFRLNMEKSGWYRFDATVRHFIYDNDIRTIALNQHNRDLSHKMGDFDLTLLPQNEKLKLYLGYSPDYESGLAGYTYDYARNEFPLLANYRTHANNFRIGADGKLLGFDLSFLQGFRHFRDDTTYFIPAPTNGNDATSTLNTFERDIPTRGHVYFTRFSIHRLIQKKVDFTGRFIYTSASTQFNFVENLTGKDQSKNTVNLDQFVANGTAKRPNGVGDIGLTWLATKRLRISDTVRFNNFRVSGGDLLNEALFRTNPKGVTLPTSFATSVGYQFTRVRQVSNLIEADYQFSDKFSVHAGYRFTDRNIHLTQIPVPLAEVEPQDFTNRTHVGIGGFKARPVKQWTIYFDVEGGTADNVFTRLANYNYHNFRLRSRVAATKTFSFNTSFVTRDNNNPSFTEIITATNPFQNLVVNIKQRTFSTSMDWTPNSRYSLSAGYTRTNVTSNAGIILFVAGAEKSGTSEYFMKDNFFFLNAYAQPAPRVSFFASYRINRDPGQNAVSMDPTIIISSFPMRFQAPEARVAFKINNRLEWNVGYQFYDYSETYLFPQNVLFNPQNLTPSNVAPQNYHARLPYTSLRVYFGRRVE